MFKSKKNTFPPSNVAWLDSCIVVCSSETDFGLFKQNSTDNKIYYPPAVTTERKPEQLLNGGRAAGVECSMEHPRLICTEDTVDIYFSAVQLTKETRYHSNPSSSQWWGRHANRWESHWLHRILWWERHRELHPSSAGCRQQRQQRNWILMDQYKFLWRAGSDCFTSDARSVIGKLAGCVWFGLRNQSMFLLCIA